MDSQQIRQQFLDFFAAKGHTIVGSSPVVPHDDPTLMFTNAGMNQFKDVFLGTGSRPYKRAADTQKCLRAGGKHNDLDDVGRDTFHHTFFEMLGNWSFGDYFKKEAIEWAWELITKVWGIDKRRLHATYFGGQRAANSSRAAGFSPRGSSESRAPLQSENTKDTGSSPLENSECEESAPVENVPGVPDSERFAQAEACGSEESLEWELEPDLEARDLWLSVTDIDPSHVHPGNMKDNFWEMGDTGPCGPCSEIHIDLTPDLSGAALVNGDDPRVMELWNLVFIQFNRATDGTLSPLPAKHVDTGMGYERLVAVLQGMQSGRLGQVSNYDTDVFTPLFDAIRKRTGAPDYTGTLPDDQYRDRQEAASPEPQAAACANHPDSRTPDALSTSADSSQTNVSRGLKPAAQQKMPGVTHEQVMVDVSYRVIADHLRCLTFALTDGAMPGNEGRGYVLRRILRRAVRYGRQYLNMHEPFLCDLVPALVDHMGDAFPELRTAHGGKNAEHVVEILRDEEAAFWRTLERGIRLFDEAANHARQHHHGKISGEDAFKLHDTYGFPIDLTELMAEENGLTIDFGKYRQLMLDAREKARSLDNPIPAEIELAEQRLAKQHEESKNKDQDRISSAKHERKSPHRDLDDPFEVETYRRLANGIFCDDSLKYVPPFDCAALLWGFGGHTEMFDSDSAKQGDEILFSTNRTPFYSEQGGQVSDTGWLETRSGGLVEVVDVMRRGDHVFHRGVVRKPKVEVGDECRVRVDQARRNRIMQNHTATHLLNWALREVLCTPDERTNPHVQQKGSLVDAEKTRFDFSHNKPVTADELDRIESLVNARIQDDLPVYTEELDQKTAREINTLRAVFGEKYPDTVRVVSIGAPIDERQAKESGQSDWLLRSPTDPKWMDYSVEFCGGTHLRRTGEVERFVLTTEEAVARGIRRVVGVSGEAARRAIDRGNELLAEAEALAQSAEPQASACAKSPDSTVPEMPSTGVESSRTNVSRGLKPAAQIHDLDAAVADLQRNLVNAVIPVLVRRRLQIVITELLKQAKERRKKDASTTADAVLNAVQSLFASADTVNAVTIVVGQVPPATPDALRTAIDWVRNKTKASAVLLITAIDQKVTMIAGMSRDVVKRGVKAGDLIREIAPLVGGKGGGRPDMAQGGGSDPDGVDAALDRAGGWIRHKVS